MKIKKLCPYCSRESIEQCAMRDWAWYPCDWEKEQRDPDYLREDRDSFADQINYE